MILTWAALPPYEFAREKFIGPFAAMTVVYLWYRVFTAPYKIVVREGHQIEFYSFLRETIIASEDIVSIKDYMGALSIKHSGGKIVVSPLMDNIASLKSILRSNRPDLEVEDLANRRFDPNE